MTTETPLTPCVRGCTQARQHVTDCEDRDTCDGCLPRPAEHGHLCHSCHRRLVQWLADVPAQVHLLRLVTGKASPNSLPDIVETNAKIVTTWRTDSGQGYPSGLYAKGTPHAVAEGEPVRLAAIDVAQELEDWISIQIEELVERYDAAGPERALTTHERLNGRHGRMRLGMRNTERPEYVWTPPPPRYVLAPGARWLLAQVGRFEYDPGIGDLYGELGEMMSRAHALAPWRQETAVLDGIECPECHRMGLVRYGGDDFVSCTMCPAHIEEDRYWAWVRILNEERRAG
ncbi:hypothetical protein [Janibacter terrae]|uniref:hypothetical protein n=1 Tax=Janibacter terrae TaxID=103817 RepID=UPI0031F97667